MAVDGELLFNTKVDTSGVNTGTKNVSSAFGKLKSGIGAVGKAIAAGIGAGVVALGGLSKTAIDSYAEYEQLVGGVDTLFKASSNKVQKYASDAYKTAGMSANEYMESVTSFSASLLQSLDGDTDKAADSANQAITDMSDNANKMGTAMESIQDAYQGFAKQNYTMLDNLKLGYGGTKTEMERLLSDAQKISGQKYDISNLNDVYSAIHAVQGELGITGTTAKEASSTIQGSIGQMKGAWTNFLAGMADPEQDFGQLVGNLVDSVVGVAENIVPRIAKLLPRLVEGLSQVAQNLMTYIPDIANQLLPALVDGATALVTSFVNILPSLIGTLIAILPQLIEGFIQIFNALVAALPDIVKVIVEALPELIPQVVDGLVSMLLTLMKYLPQIIQPIIDNLPDIIDSVLTALLDALPQLIDGFIQLVMALVNALPQIIFSLIDALPTVIDSVVNALIEALPVLIDGCITLIIELVKALPQIIMGLIKAIPKVMKGIVRALWGVAQMLWTAFSNIFSGAWDKIREVFSGIGKWFGNIFGGVITTIKKVWNKLSGFFKKLWEGIWNIIKVPINWIIDGINALWSGIYSAVKGIVDSIGGIAGAIGSVFGQDWSFSMPANPPLIPKLAHGTVVPANYGEFMAILGDNKRETEVVSPLSTIKQALIEAIAEVGGLGGNGSENIELTVNLDGEKIYKNTVKHDRQYKRRHGKTAFV